LKPGEVTQFDYKELQKNNFDDKAISEIVQVISYFNYINRVADGLGLEPEEFIDEKGYKK
jgi:alkylhydroperoxidase family enzyme